jgi:hypothetical protein
MRLAVSNGWYWLPIVADFIPVDREKALGGVRHPSFVRRHRTRGLIISSS